MLLRSIHGSAGSEILVEEFMQGEELSLFALTDGHSVLPMLPAQDHKRLLDGDEGPNTGGMGAYAPVSIADAPLIDRVVRDILTPTIGALRERGRPFTGLLYAGLMITDDGPKVVEFNCRFGDPETQALMPLLRSNLLEQLTAIARGERLDGDDRLEWRSAASVTTVVAAAGYPDAPRKGDAIDIGELPPDTTLFHAGTAKAPDGRLVTAGGRVAAVTSVAPTLATAAQRSRGRRRARAIHWQTLPDGYRLARASSPCPSSLRPRPWRATSIARSPADRSSGSRSTAPTSSASSGRRRSLAEFAARRFSTRGAVRSSSFSISRVAIESSSSRASPARFCSTAASSRSRSGDSPQWSSCSVRT